MYALLGAQSEAMSKGDRLEAVTKLARRMELARIKVRYMHNVTVDTLHGARLRRSM